MDIDVDKNAFDAVLDDDSRGEGQGVVDATTFNKGKSDGEHQTTKPKRVLRARRPPQPAKQIKIKLELKKMKALG